MIRGGGKMARKKYSAEQIIGYLREAEVLLAKGRIEGSSKTAQEKTVMVE